jgi:hypothetical protein
MLWGQSFNDQGTDYMHKNVDLNFELVACLHQLEQI